MNYNIEFERLGGYTYAYELEELLKPIRLNCETLFRKLIWRTIPDYDGILRGQVWKSFDLRIDAMKFARLANGKVFRHKYHGWIAYGPQEQYEANIQSLTENDRIRPNNPSPVKIHPISYPKHSKNPKTYQKKRNKKFRFK